jgi:hypothetical protein
MLYNLNLSTLYDEPAIDMEIAHIMEVAKGFFQPPATE